MFASRVLAATVAAATMGLGGGAAVAAPAATPSGIGHSATSPQVNRLHSTAVTQDGVVVTVDVDLSAKVMMLSANGHTEAIALPDEAVLELKASASSAAGQTVPQLTSKQKCVYALKAAGFANGVVWMLAAAVTSPTLAGAIIAGSAGMITSEMISSAASHCTS